MTCLEKVRDSIASIRENLRTLISISEVKALRAELKASNDEKFRITEEMEGFATEAAMAVAAAEVAAEVVEEEALRTGEAGPVFIPKEGSDAGSTEGSGSGPAGVPNEKPEGADTESTFVF